MEIIGELLAVSNALLYSFSNIFNKRALEKMEKDNGMIITLIINNLFNGLGLLVLFLTGHWVSFETTAVIWFVMAGALTSFVGRYLLFESVNINGPSRAGTYKVASPVFTVVIGLFVMGEWVNTGSMVGIALSLLGIWIISIREQRPKEENPKREKRPWLTRNTGVIIGLSSGLCFAIGIASRKVGMQIWPSAVGGAFLGSMSAFILTLLSFQLKGKTIPWGELTSKRALNYIYSGICTSVAILCFFIALQYTTVTVANVVASVEPLFTIALAFWMLHKKERITIKLVLGAILVSVGAALIFIY